MIPPAAAAAEGVDLMVVDTSRPDPDPRMTLQSSRIRKHKSRVFGGRRVDATGGGGDLPPRFDSLPPLPAVLTIVVTVPLPLPLPPLPAVRLFGAGAGGAVMAGSDAAPAVGVGGGVTQFRM